MIFLFITQFHKVGFYYNLPYNLKSNMILVLEGNFNSDFPHLIQEIEIGLNPSFYKS
ncbi:hypothetical protein HanIR_Chr02g0080771 [Helianthus annuus]|nr:hypothetical protein HanIR_Chr02g0080771 [Helianthus annuus]